MMVREEGWRELVLYILAAMCGLGMTLGVFCDGLGAGAQNLVYITCSSNPKGQALLSSIEPIVLFS